MIERRGMLAGGLASMASVAAGLPLGEARAQSGNGGGNGPASLLLVMEKNAGKLAFFDAADGTRVGEVGLPAYPHEFVVDAQGRFAYVGHYGLPSSDRPGEGGHSVVVVDLGERRVARTIDCAPFNRLHGIGLDGQGRLGVLSEGRDTLLILDDPGRATRPDRQAATGGRKTHLFSFSRNGERAYVTGLESGTASLVRPHDRGAKPVVTKTGQMPEGNCLSPDGKVFYVGNRRSGTVSVLDAGSMKLRDQRDVGGDPLRLYALPDGRILLADLERESISLLRPDLREIWRLPLGAKPSAASLHPGKAVAFVSLASDEVVAVDLEARRIEQRIRTGAGADVTRLLQQG